LAVLTLTAAPAGAGPTFDTSTPIGFFTNVASRLLWSQMNVKLTQIQVYPTNQYTPAVHRLLQVTANILDAQNTNFYPSVFRPLFSKDASNKIFIYGYQQVTTVSGPTDPQLSAPYDAAQLSRATRVPIVDSHGPVNVYGVPWVVGAKRGLPNFNQLSLLTAAQVTRNLEFARASLESTTFETNQAYIIGVTNQLGITFWNSYSNDYPRPLRVVVADTLGTTMTNNFYRWDATSNFFSDVLIDQWPGSYWSTVPNGAPNSSSFWSMSQPFVFQNQSVYNQSSHNFLVLPGCSGGKSLV
jgi:hypothetical protein